MGVFGVSHARLVFIWPTQDSTFLMAMNIGKDRINIMIPIEKTHVTSKEHIHQPNTDVSMIFNCMWAQQISSVLYPVVEVLGTYSCFGHSSLMFCPVSYTKLFFALIF